MHKLFDTICSYTIIQMHIYAKYISLCCAAYFLLPVTKSCSHSLDFCHSSRQGLREEMRREDALAQEHKFNLNRQFTIIMM